jgi:glutamate-1-semialdehyde aminotransferase
MKERGTLSPRLEQSRAWLKRSERVIPGCAQTFSKSPISFMQATAPNFIVRAQGARVWDPDGNEYIDWIMGLGPVILGHADPLVNRAVLAQMDAGMSLSLPHPVEVEVAELLCDLIPCAEMVRFGKNGSDATAGAVRVARGFTGRDKVACSGYHGWQDWYIGSTSRHKGVPEAVRRLTLRFPYNDLETLHRLFRENEGEIACVVMEPVTFDPPQPGYLQGVKELCHRNDCLLVFDEVVTGFRFALGGAQQYFGVVPDLACFGKALANGFPLSAIAGRADVMRKFEEVFFSFTHGGEAASLAACRQTIGELQRRDGIKQLWDIGTRLKDAANKLIGDCGLAGRVICQGLAPFTSIQFKNKDAPDAVLRSLFQQEVLRRGILTQGNHMLSLAHDATILDQTLAAYAPVFEIVAEALRRGDAEARLSGPPLQPVIRQA